MVRTACTVPQCLYKGAHYLYLRVELYLYSPYRPYGLYRASVLVQVCTLTLPFSTAIPLLPLWTVRPAQSLSRAIPLFPLWAVRPVQSRSACTGVYFTYFYLKSATITSFPATFKYNIVHLPCHYIGYITQYQLLHNVCIANYHPDLFRQIMFTFFFGAATQRGSWPPHS
jgi:hypothetical protein